jgi:hypothetical protein
MSESRVAESNTAVSGVATAGAISATEELDSTGATDEELTKAELAGTSTTTDEELTTIDELESGTIDELDTALLLEDLPFVFLEAELAALADELAGAAGGVAGAFTSGAAGIAGVAGAPASCSNSAKRSRTWAKDTWARERPKNKGKIANLRI